MQVVLVLLLTHPWTCCIGQMQCRASVSLHQEGAGDLASCPMGGWRGAGGRRCRCLLSSEELLAFGVREGTASREPWGTNTLGRSPQGWGGLSRSNPTLLCSEIFGLRGCQKPARARQGA